MREVKTLGIEFQRFELPVNSVPGPLCHRATVNNRGYQNYCLQTSTDQGEENFPKMVSDAIDV